MTTTVTETTTCPTWCVGHDSIDRDGTAVPRHYSAVTEWESPNPVDGRVDRTARVWVEQWDEPDQSVPSIQVEMSEDGQDLSPADARRLASALMRAADVIDPDGAATTRAFRIGSLAGLKFHPSLDEKQRQFILDELRADAERMLTRASERQTATG